MPPTSGGRGRCTYRWVRIGPGEPCAGYEQDGLGVRGSIGSAHPRRGGKAAARGGGVVEPEFTVDGRGGVRGGSRFSGTAGWEVRGDDASPKGKVVKRIEHAESDFRGDDAHHAGPAGDDLRTAARFTMVVTAGALLALALTLLWVSTCLDAMAAVDTAACGVPQRVSLASIPPMVLLLGGAWAFVRAYRIGRDHGTWWGWQAAGWFMLVLMVLMAFTVAPPIVGTGF